MNWIAKVLLLLPLPVFAASDVRIDLPKADAWTGQRLPLYLVVRADGAFTTAASFDLPQIPNTVILKIGNPVLGSTTEGDVDYITQRHEFAVFSQATGEIQIPPITVRFSHKKGFLGESFDETLRTGATRVTIQRPPDSEALGFLVTTGSLTIEETWTPQPGPLKTGSVLKRTIVQRAAGMTGMALAPTPVAAPEGVRVYTGDPQVNDHSERGDLSGERRETITYLVQQPGLHELPAIRYDWWNPETRKLESKTLPAVSFTATAPPPPPAKPSPVRWLAWLPAVAALAAAIVFRKQAAAAIVRLREKVDPPQRRAARAFLHACTRSEPDAALTAWARFQSLRHDFKPSAELARQLQLLFRTRYGTGPANWQGEELARAFREALKPVPVTHKAVKALPPLNPAGADSEKQPAHP